MPRSWRFDTKETPERELYLLIQHVAGVFIQELAVVLRPAGITPEQYHVLRVLRDAASEGMPCSGLAERSVSGDPDVTRLLDRLEKQGWVTRTRDSNDRRVVLARITTEGKQLLRELEKPVSSLHARQFDELTATDKGKLRKSLLVLGKEKEE